MEGPTVSLPGYWEVILSAGVPISSKDVQFSWGHELLAMHTNQQASLIGCKPYWENIWIWFWQRTPNIKDLLFLWTSQELLGWTRRGSYLHTKFTNFKDVSSLDDKLCVSKFRDSLANRAYLQNFEWVNVTCYFTIESRPPTKSKMLTDWPTPHSGFVTQHEIKKDLRFERRVLVNTASLQISRAF
jgi:hypothetical protein